MWPQQLHRLQKASGRLSSKASTSYRRPEMRMPLLQTRLKVASPSTAATTDEVPSLSSWKRVWAFALLSHLISAGILTPLFSTSSSSRSRRRPPTVFPM